ncbi:hypothetical protein MRB53_013432 [Persea americana]|uniref:Uncharacterized protein n=1 Tax=Persea americana TaxID=3435 RepID=A0ACC2K819_PERAE|nr:hypothetical protein MRB53_013432 [Persea americana]
MHVKQGHLKALPYKSSTIDYDKLTICFGKDVVTGQYARSATTAPSHQSTESEAANFTPLQPDSNVGLTDQLGGTPSGYLSDICKAQVLGYPNAEFKGFSSIEEARESFLNYHGQAKLILEPASMLSQTSCRRSERNSVRGEALLCIIIDLLFICFSWCFSIYLYTLSH